MITLSLNRGIACIPTDPSGLSDDYLLQRTSIRHMMQHTTI